MHTDYNLQIVLIFTIGFAFASLLGYFSYKLRLSPTLGYLLAGYVIGPYSPGFVADMSISEQLAEVGVILMMFGVGLHFKLQDLWNVKTIAIPGAIAQTGITAIAVACALYFGLNMPIETGIVIGIGCGVASTVVLVRMLTDYNLLSTPQGHIAMGWLIVEDILTVIVLIFLPSLAISAEEPFSIATFATSITMLLLKFCLLALIAFTAGKKIATYVLTKVADLYSHELFTLTILALTFLIATGSAWLFQTSIALGAFIAGMVIGQTHVRHQASVNALPMKDAFTAIFFLSVGMLFNANAIVENFTLFTIILAAILILKPLIAYVLTAALKYPTRTAVTIAIALAQIGEFSFILAEEAMRLQILPDEGYDIIVACALISIALNPLLFRSIDFFTKLADDESHAQKPVYVEPHSGKHAIIVGSGAIAEKGVTTLENANFATTTLLLDQENGTLPESEVSDLFTHIDLANTDFLGIVAPNIQITIAIITYVREQQPDMPILACLATQKEADLLQTLSVNTVCYETEATLPFCHMIASILKLKPQPMLINE